MQYWLFKSEPHVFSFDDLKKRELEGSPWDGVRNYAARNNMRLMRIGDLGFFYHTGKEKCIVGVVKITALAYPDPTIDDPSWECVDVMALYSLPSPISLSAIKANKILGSMVLAVNPRLSVQPVRKEEWYEISKMSVGQSII